MVNETYPCYVRIGDTSGAEELVELPTENDGSMLLSTITAQFPHAIGLRFKSEAGAWRGVRVTHGVLDAPLEGWGDKEYKITVAKPVTKRKIDDDAGPRSKREMLQDLIVLGLPFGLTEDELKNHFQKYGELAHWEIKTDRQTKKSKGFGFVRFTEESSIEAALAASHNIGGRNCDVRIPKKEGHQQNSHGQDDGIATKLFIGRLPRGATTEDLRTHFSDYGTLNDVYIPSNFRGFGFVTFASQSSAQAALNTQHVIKGNYINVTYPSPKAGEPNPQQNMQMQQQSGQQPPQQYGYGNMQGNMAGNYQGNYQQGNYQQGNYQQGNYQGNAGYMQGNMQQQMSQQGWYGNQSAAKMGSGYYTNGYFQSGGKVQTGKSV